MNKTRPVPGTVPVDGIRFVYLESREKNVFDKFGDFVSCVDDTEGPSHGGMIDEEFSLVLPNGSRFYAISFKGDLEGWRRNIENFSRHIGISYGEIEKGFFVFSTDKTVQLSSCELHDHSTYH